MSKTLEVQCFFSEFWQKDDKICTSAHKRGCQVPIGQDLFYCQNLRTCNSQMKMIKTVIFCLSVQRLIIGFGLLFVIHDMTHKTIYEKCTIYARTVR